MNVRPVLPDWPALMSIDLAAAYLDVSQKTFVTLTRLKSVKPVETPLRILRYRRSDLDALLDSLPLRGRDAERPVEPPPLDSAEEGLRRVAAQLERRRGGR